MAAPHQRCEQEREEGLAREAGDEAPGAAERPALLRPQQHVDEGRELGRRPHEQRDREQREAGVGADEIAKVRRRGRFQRADGEQRHPRRRAEEHQDREGELIAADRTDAGQQQEPPVLHVALAPAQIAPDEFEQGRGILLEALILERQHPHLVAGAPHQHRLDLVVAEDLRAALFRQRLQIAMRHEGGETQQRVVTPIGPAVGLPPRAADGVGAHAEAHAELEHAGEGAGRRQADDEALHDAELGIALHDAHEPEHRFGVS